MNQFYDILQRRTVMVIISLMITTGISSESMAQGGGAFAGTRNSGSRRDDERKLSLSTKQAERVIVVQGVAEIRVKPTEIRLVMAVVTEGGTAKECKLKAAKIVEALRLGWKDIGIESNDVFEDFIAIISVYKYEEQKKDDLLVLQEMLDGYRYQTNLHLKLPSEARAHEALDVAFGLNITNIIMFDYWHPKLKEKKLEAMKNAIRVAREKSNILLAAELFPTRPKLINIRESSKTVFPINMYLTYDNEVEQTVVLPYRTRNDVARISAVRPRTTFYRGPSFEGDSLSPELPMMPEISIVSTVRLFFEAPRHSENRQTENGNKNN